MSAPYEPYSDASGSDSDDAPEEVTLSTAKKGLQQEKKKALEEQRRYAAHTRATTIDPLNVADSGSADLALSDALKRNERKPS